MSTPIVECIANYSEARRPEVIEAIAQAIIQITGAILLDRHSDLDHNRTVLTFVGSPAAVEEAAFRSIARAAELISLDEHTGEHPRIGATDVVPFVPLQDVTMQDCIQIAHRLGQRVGDELKIPVYLYEEAATRPERKNLENIRRGQYERLKEEILTDPMRAPDYGPARLGSAGATVIGARQPLIAYNVYLNSADVTIAEKIAKAVRQSSGGLRYVKALGMLVEGHAQVSMNLTNYHQTPVARVVEMIRSEASRYGVATHHSELVGLIPQAALVDAAVWYLQLDQFTSEQILETRLNNALQKAHEPSEALTMPATSQDFLEALAAGTPTPGGGSAAAYAGAASAALTAMVAHLTIGKKKYIEVEGEMRQVLMEAEALRKLLTEAVTQDAVAYEAVMQAYRLPKETQEQIAERSRAIEQATIGAIQVPLEVARMSVTALELARRVIVGGNRNALCDGGTAAALARAALTGASLNVQTNANTLQDRSSVDSLLSEIKALERRATELEGEIRIALQERGGLSL